MDTLHIKTYPQLSVDELYTLLKARQDVFVVEQRCAYPDIDGRDPEALHLFYTDEAGRLTACLRLLPKDGEPGTVHMGRVLTLRRGAGLGRRLLHDGIAAAEALPGARSLYVEAQSYAASFYVREGFCVCSEEFLEDGIPHVQMRRALNP